MKSLLFWFLLGLNALLLASLIGGPWLVQPAEAQARRPADYLFIPGSIGGVANDVVYVLDTTNGQLSALVYDDNRQQIDTMPPLDLNRVFQMGVGEPPRPRPRR